MDEGRKRVLLIAAAILAAGKLCQYNPKAGRVLAARRVGFRKRWPAQRGRSLFPAGNGLFLHRVGKG